METFLNSLDGLLALSEIVIQTLKVSDLMNYILEACFKISVVY